ncbi:MAG: CRISPR-associated endonuclease Cas1 [Acidobacteriota bacterium]
MASLVISGEVITVRLISKHVEVIRWVERGREAEARLRIPLVDVERVVIIGRPSVSYPTLAMFLRLGIPCYLLTRKGRWLGALTPDKNLNGARRIRQYEVGRDEALQLRVARKLVHAKLRNSRRVLQRLSANRGESHLPSQKEADATLNDLAERALRAEGLDELRGYEGMGAGKYFARLGRFFPAEIPFRGRSRRPPKDPANALLSWTYTVLLGEVDGAVRKHGLDPAIGFLHGLRHGAPALALDLLEPLRAPICDLLVLNILNHKILGEGDFRFDAEDGGFYLREEARRPFFQSYEAAMNRKFTPAKGDAHTDFRRVIDDQVVEILRVLEDPGYEPEFFLMP